MLVVALNHVRRLRTFLVVPAIRADIAREPLTVFGDVLERGDLHGVVLVLLQKFKASLLQFLSAEQRNFENGFFNFPHEGFVGVVAADFECAPDILQEVDMAELQEGFRVHVVRGHTDCFVVVAHDGEAVVARVLQLREELHPRLVALARSQHADGDVVSAVVNAPQERNLLVAPFHRDVLAVHDDDPAELLRVAVLHGDAVVVRECITLGFEEGEGLANTLADFEGKTPDRGTHEVLTKQLLFPSMVATEALPAVTASESLQAIA